jgi:hypothetical protein
LLLMNVQMQSSIPVSSFFQKINKQLCTQLWDLS